MLGVRTADLGLRTQLTPDTTAKPDKGCPHSASEATVGADTDALGESRHSDASAHKP